MDYPSYAENLAQTKKLLKFIPEVTASNFGRVAGYSNWSFRDFPQSLLANIGTVYETKLRPHPLIHVANHPAQKR
jgi:hypothetical protein